VGLMEEAFSRSDCAVAESSRDNASRPRFRNDPGNLSSSFGSCFEFAHGATGVILIEHRRAPNSYGLKRKVGQSLSAFCRCLIASFEFLRVHQGDSPVVLRNGLIGSIQVKSRYNAGIDQLFILCAPLLATLLPLSFYLIESQLCGEVELRNEGIRKIWHRDPYACLRGDTATHRQGDDASE